MADCRNYAQENERAFLVGRTVKHSSRFPAGFFGFGNLVGGSRTAFFSFLSSLLFYIFVLFDLYLFLFIVSIFHIFRISKIVLNFQKIHVQNFEIFHVKKMFRFSIFSYLLMYFLKIQKMSRIYKENQVSLSVHMY